MNKNKLLYEAPTAETLVVRFEGNVMQQASPLRYGNPGRAAGLEKDFIDNYGEDF